MSLNVTPEILAKTETGTLSQADFVELISGSLPRAWKIVTDLVARLGAGTEKLVSWGNGPMDDETRGELLRMFAGTAIRDAVEAHFGVKLLFQNCHNAAVVRPNDKESKEAEEFTSMQTQIKSQKPEFKHC